MYKSLSIVSFVALASALPLHSSIFESIPDVHLERRVEISLPLGPLGDVQVGALEPDGTVDVCANVSKEALGAISEALSTVDLSAVNVNQLLGPLSAVLTGVVDVVPADISVGALNSDGTATVCASVPSSSLKDTKRAVSVDLGGAGLDLKKREPAVSVDLGGAGLDLKKREPAVSVDLGGAGLDLKKREPAVSVDLGVAGVSLKE